MMQVGDPLIRLREHDAVELVIVHPVRDQLPVMSGVQA